MPKQNIPQLNTYFNDNGDDIEVKTPILANLLPILGFSIGAGYGVATKKTPMMSFAIGVGVGVVCSIPKFLLLRKALNDVASDREKAASASNHKDSNDNSAHEAVTEPATADSLIDLLEEISIANGTSENFFPKKEYFKGIFESFTQEEMDATYDLLTITKHIPKNPSEKESLATMKAISELEDVYGKDFIANINSRLNDVNQAVNNMSSDKETIAA